jgi:hypothetical protein
LQGEREKGLKKQVGKLALKLLSLQKIDGKNESFGYIAGRKINAIERRVVSPDSN